MRGLRTAMKSGPRSPQLEKALAQKRRPNTAKNKQINKYIKNQSINKVMGLDEVMQGEIGLGEEKEQGTEATCGMRDPENRGEHPLGKEKEN